MTFRLNKGVIMFKYSKEIVFSSGDASSHGIISSFVSRGEKVLEFGCAKGELSSHLKNELEILGYVCGKI